MIRVVIVNIQFFARRWNKLIRRNHIKVRGQVRKTKYSPGAQVKPAERFEVVGEYGRCYQERRRLFNFVDHSQARLAFFKEFFGDEILDWKFHIEGVLLHLSFMGGYTVMFYHRV